MSARDDNAKTEKAMRGRAAERGKHSAEAGKHECCGAPQDGGHLGTCDNSVMRGGGTIQVPPDKDKLARWQGDGLVLLARLQESYGELWLFIDVERGPRRDRTNFVGRLIREAVEHLEAMP